ncbi:hypothetical protein GCM10027570_26500 [Streptomonospora sediminis]
MNDRSPYDDGGGDPGFSRRGRRRREPEPDPLDDGYAARPYSGGRNIEPDPYADPRTGPRAYGAPAARSGQVADPLTDPWPGRADPPGGPGHDERPPRWEDAQGDRPRGRRHRGAAEPAPPGPATGPQPQVPADGDTSRGRRRRSRPDEEAEEHLAWTRPAPGEADDAFQPPQPRVLDFDAVPVRRKRPRGDDAPDESRGGRRRRGDTGSMPAVADPDSGAFPAVDDRGAGADEAAGGDGRDGRHAGRRRRSGPTGDTGTHAAYAGADTGTAAPPRRDEPDREQEQDEPEYEEAPRRGRRRGRGEPADETGARPRRRRGGRSGGPADPPPDGPDDPESADGADGADGADDGDEDDDGRGGSGRRSRRSRRAEHGSSRSRGRSQRSARKQRGRERGPRKGPVIVLVVVLVAVLGTGGYFGWGYLFPPDYEGQGSGEVEFVVEQGATGTGIAQSLAEEGVVASPRAFLNQLDDAEGSVAPGTYRLRARMSGEAAVAMLMDPSSRVRAHITFKEGLRSGEILKLLSEQTAIPMEDLRAAYEDGAGLGLPDYAEQGAEGYLFPDTYDMPADAEPADLLKRMVDRFHQAADQVSLEKTAEERGLTPNEAMSVAAIVQAESGSTEDMPKVARVVYNRLEQGMELGMDSTCFYVIGEYGIALNSQQLAECKSSGSDYATYGRKGLPAGPIVSPGGAAIKAALNPAQGDWLYFVATDPKNGVTEFAETHTEFLQLKQEFQQNRGDL